MQIYRNLLSGEAITRAFELFRSLPNQVVIDGEQVDRHAPSAIGHFLLAKFTNEEFDPDLLQPDDLLGQLVNFDSQNITFVYYI